jgi:hypothetical protein
MLLFLLGVSDVFVGIVEELKVLFSLFVGESSVFTFVYVWMVNS